jgi:DNA-binding MarR family transcriptional regulator
MSYDIKDIINLLNNPALSNSSRLGILIFLYINSKSTFTDIQSYTNIPKSSLHMHLQILEKNGLVKITKGFTLGGPRTIIEITDKGIGLIKEYINIIRNIKI